MTEETEEKTPEIILKWRTLKGWENMTEEGIKLLQRYYDIGACLSVMCQKDTDEQIQILIDLVSLPNMKIYLDWDGKYVTKDEAINYIKGESCKIARQALATGKETP